MRWGWGEDKGRGDERCENVRTCLVRRDELRDNELENGGRGAGLRRGFEKEERGRGNQTRCNQG